MKLHNTYFLLRHGQAISNVKKIISCWPETFDNPLTKEGVKQVKEAASILRNKHIDLIFTSDILRAKQTAQIVAKELNIELKFDTRLREYNVGAFNGVLISDFAKEYPDLELRFTKKPSGGEDYGQIRDRMYGFLKDVDGRYKEKNILIVSHQVSLALLILKVKGLSEHQVFEEYFHKDKMKNAEVKELNSPG